MQPNKSKVQHNEQTVKQIPKYIDQCFPRKFSINQFHHYRTVLFVLA